MNVQTLINRTKVEVYTNMKLTDEHYDYLMWLRDSGETNMWGAAPYLQREFDIPYAEAKDLLIEWINLFEEVE